MDPIGRNDPCHCGSGKKYKRCHLDIDRDAGRAFQEALPLLEEKARVAMERDRRLREEYGVHINHVPPIQRQGRKVWAIGSRLYPDRPPNETFHEFILHLLRGTLGDEWRAEQASLPDAEQHFLYVCFAKFGEFLREHADPEVLQREGHMSAKPSGWADYLLSLAWDIATLVHSGDLPDSLIDRLRDRDNYQGARYELAIAAIFARLNCSIRWLDDDPQLRTIKHVEFEATHRPTGQAFAVEAKSRHRPGVINRPGSPDAENPLRADARGVRNLYMEAIKKTPNDLPYFVFIDINAPSEVNDGWQADVQRWMDRLPKPTAAQPADCNATYITNFSPHYDADGPSQGGAWFAIWPKFARAPLEHDFQPGLLQALDSYGRVPAFAEDGTLLGD